MVADEIGFRAAVVGRDATGSALMVEVLTQNLGCAATSPKASNLLRILASTKIDIAVISANLGPKSGAGFDLARQVSQAFPSLPILILIDGSGSDSIIRAFQSGARGVFNLEMPMSQFLDSVNHVRKGYIWAGPQEAAVLLGSMRGIQTHAPTRRSPSSTLTAREFDVAHLAADGKTNEAIASQLMFSEHTVKNCLSRAFEKLGVTSRTELLPVLKLLNSSQTKLAEAKPAMKTAAAK